MLLFLYLGLYFSASFIGSCSVKKNSATLGGGKTDRPVFVIITAAIACLFFAAINGFAIRFNAVTLLYACGFSAVVLSSLVLTLAIYRYASIPAVSVIRSTFNLLTTSLLGSVLFSEKIAANTWVRIALLIVASILIYFSRTGVKRKSEPNAAKDAGRGNRAIFILLMALLVLSACFTTLITKSFSAREDVTDANSYYFATNLIMLLAGTVWLLAVGKGDLHRVGAGLKNLKIRDYAVIVLQTVSSNVVSLVTVPLVAMLDVASFSAYSSAISVVAATVASICFREKQNVFSLSAIVIAIVSFLIGAL